jgi:hypothetical protein
MLEQQEIAYCMMVTQLNYNRKGIKMFGTISECGLIVRLVTTVASILGLIMLVSCGNAA